jgi:hypothetical protein
MGMLMNVLDHFWVALGVRREELRRERGRGALYAILLLSVTGSLFLGADLVLNVSGRFG